MRTSSGSRAASSAANCSSAVPPQACSTTVPPVRCTSASRTSASTRATSATGKGPPGRSTTATILGGTESSAGGAPAGASRTGGRCGVGRGNRSASCRPTRRPGCSGHSLRATARDCASRSPTRSAAESRRRTSSPCAASPGPRLSPLTTTGRPASAAARARSSQRPKRRSPRGAPAAGSTSRRASAPGRATGARPPASRPVRSDSPCPCSARSAPSCPGPPRSACSCPDSSGPGAPSGSASRASTPRRASSATSPRSSCSASGAESRPAGAGRTSMRMTERTFPRPVGAPPLSPERVHRRRHERVAAAATSPPPRPPALSGHGRCTRLQVRTDSACPPEGGSATVKGHSAPLPPAAPARRAPHHRPVHRPEDIPFWAYEAGRNQPRTRSPAGHGREPPARRSRRAHRGRRRGVPPC